MLHLHLMRFQYDPVTDNSVKSNDRFEFYEKIKLDDYIKCKNSVGNNNASYTLHAVSRILKEIAHIPDLFLMPKEK